jgi:hypothetical protein
VAAGWTACPQQLKPRSIRSSPIPGNSRHFPRKECFHALSPPVEKTSKNFFRRNLVKNGGGGAFNFLFCFIASRLEVGNLCASRGWLEIG